MLMLGHLVWQHRHKKAFVQQPNSCLGPLKLCHYLLTKGVTENGTETVFG